MISGYDYDYDYIYIYIYIYIYVYIYIYIYIYIYPLIYTPLPCRRCYSSQMPHKESRGVAHVWVVDKWRG